MQWGYALSVRRWYSPKLRIDPQHLGQPENRFFRRGISELRRIVTRTGTVCSWRPSAAILDISAEFLVAERIVGSGEDIDTAVVFVVLDAGKHDP